jgi:NDP-sugar pyrophosphorylase family protein
MQAMVLAAGFGTRLWPLTAACAKPAVPFLDRPLVARLVERLKSQGFDRVVVNLHHLPHSVTQALVEHPDVKFSREASLLGTAGGIARALRIGALRRDEPVLVVNGKIETDADFADLRRAHDRGKHGATLLLTPNTRREAFREVHFEGGRVVGFGAGRQPEGPDPWCFTGVHVLSADVVAGLRPEFSDTVRDVYPALMQAGRLGAHLHRGRWWEFSTPERYLGLHQRAWSTFAAAERPPDRSVFWGPRPTGVRATGCIVLDPEAVPAGQYRDEILGRADRGDPELVAGARVEQGILRVPLDPQAVEHASRPDPA